MNQRTLPKFELIYFPIHGRAEMLRLTFALGQAEFTDVPVTDWATLKPQTPLGQVPVLKETQGEDTWLIPQSGAIIRHLGRVLNLYGQTEREHTIADYVLESAMDWRAKFIPVAFAKMFGTAQDVQDPYWNEQLASHLRTMDKLLASPSKSGPWFAGESPTIADVAVWDTLDGNLAKRAELLDSYPALRAFYDRFASQPGVAAHLATRRPSEHRQA